MVPVCRTLVIACLLATITSTLRVYPHQLAYFNEAVGGPENGYKHLLHSNLDWGQDLLLAREWTKRQRYPVNRVYATGMYLSSVAEVLGFQRLPADKDEVHWLLLPASTVCVIDKIQGEMPHVSPTSRVSNVIWSLTVGNAN